MPLRNVETQRSRASDGKKGRVLRFCKCFQVGHERNQAPWDPRMEPSAFLLAFRQDCSILRANCWALEREGTLVEWLREWLRRLRSGLRTSGCRRSSSPEPLESEGIPCPLRESQVRWPKSTPSRMNGFVQRLQNRLTFRHVPVRMPKHTKPQNDAYSLSEAGHVACDLHARAVSNTEASVPMAFVANHSDLSARHEQKDTTAITTT